MDEPTRRGSNMQCSEFECDETAIHACLECSNKYFCECCDGIRHRHKTRRNHLRVLLIKHAENIALKNDTSLACHVCSTTDVAESVKCEKCTYEKSNGILCERCNKLWHSHKDRVDHDAYPLTKYVIQFLKLDDDQNMDDGYERISVDEGNEPVVEVGATDTKIDEETAKDVAEILKTYLDPENIKADPFLKRHIDDLGFVTLKFLMKQPKLTILKNDDKLLKEILMRNPSFGMNSDGDKTKLIGGDTTWSTDDDVNVEAINHGARNTEPEDIPNSMCDVCCEDIVDLEGGKVCQDCDDVPRCTRCDLNWHKHPTRTGHQRKTIQQYRQEQAAKANSVFVSELEPCYLKFINSREPNEEINSSICDVLQEIRRQSSQHATAPEHRMEKIVYEWMEYVVSAETFAFESFCHLPHTLSKPSDKGIYCPIDYLEMVADKLSTSDLKLHINTVRRALEFTDNFVQGTFREKEIAEVFNFLILSVYNQNMLIDNLVGRFPEIRTLQKTQMVQPPQRQNNPKHDYKEPDSQMMEQLQQAYAYFSDVEVGQALDSPEVICNGRPYDWLCNRRQLHGSPV